MDLGPISRMTLNMRERIERLFKLDTRSSQSRIGDNHAAVVSDKIVASILHFLCWLLPGQLDDEDCEVILLQATASRSVGMSW